MILLPQPPVTLDGVTDICNCTQLLRLPYSTYSKVIVQTVGCVWWLWSYSPSTHSLFPPTPFFLRVLFHDWPPPHSQFLHERKHGILVLMMICSLVHCPTRRDSSSHSWIMSHVVAPHWLSLLSGCGEQGAASTGLKLCPVRCLRSKSSWHDNSSVVVFWGSFKWILRDRPINIQPASIRAPFLLSHSDLGKVELQGNFSLIVFVGGFGKVFYIPGWPVIPIQPWLRLSWWPSCSALPRAGETACTQCPALSLKMQWWFPFF